MVPVLSVRPTRIQKINWISNRPDPNTKPLQENNPKGNLQNPELMPGTLFYGSSWNIIRYSNELF